MRETNLAGIDLNLLPALEALIRRRNVTRAGEDVGLSQPAMSRALARLRDLLDDPILVKTAGGLAPTARAQNLLPQLSAALDGAAGIIRPAAFDASALERVFRIASADGPTLLLGPALMAALAREAPRASLLFLPVTLEVRERVDSGDIDLVFATSTTPLPPGAHSEVLATDGFLLACRRGLRPEGHVWTLPEYAAQPHATVSIFGDRLTDIDAELAQAGLVRRIAFTSPHFVAALATVASTDCVTVLSAALARRFAPALGLQLYAPPLKQKDLVLTTVASATRAQDPALVWLRARLRAAARDAMAP